jgi:glycosyltransferase involved in cell wall biosynthesis
VLSSASDYDAVVVYREASLLGPAIFERMLAKAGVRMILDFDDAIWMRGPASANGVFSRLAFRSKTATICRLASSVVVGNRYLANYASRYSEHVTVIPSTVDLNQSLIQPESPMDGPLTVVWIGSPSSMPYLELVRNALMRFGQRRETVLRVICSRPFQPPIPGVRTEFIPWNAQDEAIKLGQSQIGIMPLPDNEFTRGKCGLKALQYMAVGRPVIASPVGVNSEIITHGSNGLLASTDDEWITALEALAASPGLRARLGREGRRTVERRFSAEVGAAAFAGVVHDVVNRPSLIRSAVRSA